MTSKIEPGFRWTWSRPDGSRIKYGVCSTEEEARQCIEKEENHWKTIRKIEEKEEAIRKEFRERKHKAKDKFLALLQPLFDELEKVYGHEETIDAIWEAVEEIK